MKEIKLTQGKTTLCDNEDYEELNKYKWYTQKNRNKYYAVRAKYFSGVQKIISMHNIIMKTPKGMETDHVNGLTLDNRKSNLRICTHSENSMNRIKQSNNKSGFKGISWSKDNKKWRATIQLNYKKIHLGYFSDKEWAYAAYCTAATKYHKEFAHF